MTKAEYDALPSRYSFKKNHLPYDQAKMCLRTQAPHVTSANKYRKWIKESGSYFMPVHPERVYPDFDWSDFLNAKVIPLEKQVQDAREREYRPMWDAIRWAQRYCLHHGITRRTQWEDHYRQVDDIPEDIPLYPHRVYQKAGYPGFQTWCGGTSSAIAEAATKVEPILTLMHPSNAPQNVLQTVTWAKGLPELRDAWRKQSDFDRIIGIWKLDRTQMPEIERILSEMGSFDGERWTFPNVSAVTWELNSHLDIVKAR